MRSQNKKRSPAFVSVFMIGGLLMATVGCTPKMIVRKSPTDHNRGIRYYRPKPYLKIEPAEIAVDKNESAFVPGLVRISLVYMPDFSEEYSIEVRSGLGIANVGIKLEDGWNLTEISQELDSQTDENVEAISSLLKAAGGLIPTSERGNSAEDVSFTVPARNVPLGFYESVVGRDACDVKRLYGFRYVGFIPFAGCPIEMSGHSHALCIDSGSCLDPSACGMNASLYGLTFINGEMVFQPLEVMASTPTVSAVQSNGVKTPTSDSLSSSKSSAQELLPTPNGDGGFLATQLRAYLKSVGQSVDSVRVGSHDQFTTIQIGVPRDTPDQIIRTTVEDWMAERFSNTDSIIIEITATPL